MWRCFIYGLLAALSLSAVRAVASEPPTIEMIRERMEAIGIRSVRSADGCLVVSGPDSFQNAMLLALVGEICQRVQSVVGLPLRFDARSVRVLIVPDAANRDSIVLEHVMSGGGWIHRVVLTDYAEMQTRAGLEALCAAFIALYLHPRQDADKRHASYVVPLWLHQGVQQVLTDEDRDRTLDQAVRFWRAGVLPSPLQVMNEQLTPGTEGDGELRLLTARGAFVLWLAGDPFGANTVAALLQRLSDGHDANLEWLREQLPGGGDPDALWDRWMQSQGKVVRSLGRLTLTHMEDLQAEWHIQPGTGGIPQDVVLPPGADCVSLLQHRDQPWFRAVVRQKRYRIEMLAQGRPVRFRELAEAYAKILSAIEAGEHPATVVGMNVNARRQWNVLHESVNQAGGVWSEP